MLCGIILYCITIIGISIQFLVERRTARVVWRPYCYRAREEQVVASRFICWTLLLCYHLWFLVQTGYCIPFMLVQLIPSYFFSTHYQSLLLITTCSSTHHFCFCVKDACFRTPDSLADLRTRRPGLLLQGNRWLFLIIFVRTNSSFHTWLFLVAQAPKVGDVLSCCARIAAVLTISSFINRLLLVITKLFTMNWFITFR